VRGDLVKPDAVARLTTVPVAAQMPDQRGLEEAIDIGLGPVRSTRGPLGRTALGVLADLAPMRRAA
jgi:hypothetical protein